MTAYWVIACLKRYLNVCDRANRGMFMFLQRVLVEQGCVVICARGKSMLPLFKERAASLLSVNPVTRLVTSYL